MTTSKNSITLIANTLEVTMTKNSIAFIAFIAIISVLCVSTADAARRYSLVRGKGAITVSVHSDYKSCKKARDKIAKLNPHHSYVCLPTSR